MKLYLVIFAFVLPTIAGYAFGAERLQISNGNDVIYGGSASISKTHGDTILLMGRQGSGAQYIGDFESGWNGWTPIDLTQPTTSHWQVSDYNQAESGNLAAWCGDMAYVACSGSSDADGGYGNNWHDTIAFRATVADPSMSSNIQVTAILQIDTEPGYDFTYLSTKNPGVPRYTDIQSWDSKGTVAIDESFTVLPVEYFDVTDVYIVFRFQSDGGWSDEDCDWPTVGACQVDDISITVSQLSEDDIVSFTNFQDGTFGDWYIDFPDGVGNFAKLWKGLADVDPCATNSSRQVAFIDDGLVVPGTGGTQCLDWCYGPQGYIVNWNGGLAGWGNLLNTAVVTPVIPWPSGGQSGMELSFDVYNHTALDFGYSGVYFAWRVRSADTDGSSGPIQIIEEMPFRNRGSFVLDIGQYHRSIELVSDLLVPGCDEVQVQLSAFQYQWEPLGHGPQGTPGPYFDNVSVKAFTVGGPTLVAEEGKLSQDNFPEVDTIDYNDLGSLHVRFDMAESASYDFKSVVAGDSLVVGITPGRFGATLGQQEMHYTIDANPLFDSYRTTSISGIVAGKPAVRNGTINTSEWQFDLPDTGTLFPGDVLHYYFRGTDDLMGDVQHTILPANLTGFGNFVDGPLAYDTRFVVHALPSISDDNNGGYESPTTLFWNDQGSGGSESAWYSAFQQLGYVERFDYDVFRTSAASRDSRSNGLGARTDGPALEVYDKILYTSGAMTRSTLTGGDTSSNIRNDLSTITNWLSGGNRDLFLSGDNIVSDIGMLNISPGREFVNNVLGVDYENEDLKLLINNQTAPIVLSIPSNPVVQNIDRWIAYGGCAAINTFDAVTVRAGATRLAEFTNPSGTSGQYPFAAMVENIYDSTNRIIFQPYDLRFITIDPSATQTGPHPARVQVLSDILDYFGSSGQSTPSPVAPVARFTTSNYPNPFNPSTEISYTIKSPGHLVLKIYNTRGELIKTLVDEHVDHDSSVQWRGDNNQGGQVSSGIYFYEARIGNEVKINKMALVK